MSHTYSSHWDPPDAAPTGDILTARETNQAPALFQWGLCKRCLRSKRSVAASAEKNPSSPPHGSGECHQKRDLPWFVT